MLMEQLVELSDTEVRMGFAASCVEGVARRLGISYREAYDRMERFDMISGYILPCYEALHSESREQVKDHVIEYLRVREEAL